MTGRIGRGRHFDGAACRRRTTPETIGSGRNTAVSRFIALFLVLFATACADAGLTAPDPTQSPIPVGDEAGSDDEERGVRRGRSEPFFRMIDELQPWDAARWLPQEHTFGHGRVDAKNVGQTSEGLRLGIPQGSYDGGEILSNRRFGFRTIEARMRTPDAPGSISAFFFYEGIVGGNDEIDIEIFNDGSRTIWFTTWVRGQRTNHVAHQLPFDPGAAAHDYRIEWTTDRIAFYVDGVLYEEMTEGIPQNDMFIMSNAWWPSWISSPPAPADTGLEIHRISY